MQRRDTGKEKENDVADVIISHYARAHSTLRGWVRSRGQKLPRREDHEPRRPQRMGRHNGCGNVLWRLLRRVVGVSRARRVTSGGTHALKFVAPT